jgi:hypothetical protein
VPKTEQQQPEWIARVWWCLGLVAAESGGSLDIEGQSYETTACFTKSHQIFTELRDEIERAWLLRDWAAYELRQGHRGRGQAMWQEVRGIFETLGLTVEAGQMADLPQTSPFL